MAGVPKLLTWVRFPSPAPLSSRRNPLCLAGFHNAITDADFVPAGGAERVIASSVNPVIAPVSTKNGATCAVLLEATGVGSKLHEIRGEVPRR